MSHCPQTKIAAHCIHYHVELLQNLCTSVAAVWNVLAEMDKPTVQDLLRFEDEVPRLRIINTQAMSLVLEHTWL